MAGDRWEADGTYTKGIKICLIPVRDLKTGFILGSAQSRAEDEVSIENALREAKEVARKCPKSLDVMEIRRMLKRLKKCSVIKRR
ncbi:MAG: hypothetical protein QXH37_09290 [Candidatus Bathyarchaeia archaeon]